MDISSRPGPGGLLPAVPASRPARRPPDQAAGRHTHEVPGVTPSPEEQLAAGRARRHARSAELAGRRLVGEVLAR
ncbi:hypothetical protein [Kitasatospora cinereorecta]|uniref:Uncharacterized protein n=1 Tax=Kitasatospora cinereorecta TaxID=285560 RepID=A0ABW0VLL3_9ACTN